MRRRNWIVPAVMTGAALLLSGCTDQQPTAPASLSPSAARDQISASDITTPRLVRMLAAQRGIGRLEDPRFVRPALVQLGQALMFDPILSGNHDVSCSTCHLPAFATGDGRSLSIGAGGTGLGPSRTHPQGVFIARNAPAVFDIAELQHMFWDGRVEVNRRGQFHTPAATQLTPAMTRVFEFGANAHLPAARRELPAVGGRSLPAERQLRQCHHRGQAGASPIPGHGSRDRALHKGCRHLGLGEQ